MHKTGYFFHKRAVSFALLPSVRDLFCKHNKHYTTEVDFEILISQTANYLNNSNTKNLLKPMRFQHFLLNLVLMTKYLTIQLPDPTGSTYDHNCTVHMDFLKTGWFFYGKREAFYFVILQDSTCPPKLNMLLYIICIIKNNQVKLCYL